MVHLSDQCEHEIVWKYWFIIKHIKKMIIVHTHDIQNILYRIDFRNNFGHYDKYKYTNQSFFL